MPPAKVLENPLIVA